MPIDQRARRDIEEYGWHVCLVLEEKDEPPFAFTVGLSETQKHPELILFGLPQPTAHKILNVLGRRVSDGERFRPGEDITGVLESSSLRMVVFPHEFFLEYLGTALRVLGKSDFEVLQVVWPNRSGGFPTDEGVDPPPNQPVPGAGWVSTIKQG